MATTRRVPVLATLLAVLVAPGPVSTGAPSPSPDRPAAARFLPSTAADLAALIPPPPEARSIAGRADLEAVLQAQAWRSSQQVEWAKRIADGDVFDNADVLGPWFSARSLPFTAQFIVSVEEELRGPVGRAKDAFRRPRPPMVDPHVAPCVHLPSGGSYPSGHAAAIYARAEVLSEVFPDRRQALFAWADRAAWGRVLGGVHFPTDLVAGRDLAAAVISAMRRNPEFLAAIERCRAEAAPFLAEKAA